MKKLIFQIAGVLLVIFIGLYIYTRTNNSTIGVGTVSLSVDCSLTRLLLKSVVNVRVTSLTSSTHSNISVKISTYNKNGDFIKDNYTTFDRTLAGNSDMSKPVIVPGKAHSCSCEIQGSN